MSADSPIALCNAALTLCGGNTLLSFLDGTKEAKLCNIHYERLRDAVTAEAQWTHATTRFGPMVPDTTPPVYRYSYQYLLPVDLLTLVEASPDQRGHYQIDDYEVEDNRLLCNHGGGVYIKYIRRVTDTTKFVMLYTEALVARLAAELAIPLAESRSLQQQHFALYRAKVDDAMAADGMQGRNKATAVRGARNARYSEGPGRGFYTAGTG